MAVVNIVVRMGFIVCVVQLAIDLLLVISLMKNLYFHGSLTWSLKPSQWYDLALVMVQLPKNYMYILIPNCLPFSLSQEFNSGSFWSDSLMVNYIIPSPTPCAWTFEYNRHWSSLCIDSIAMGMYSPGNTFAKVADARCINYMVGFHSFTGPIHSTIHPWPRPRPIPTWDALCIDWLE